MRIRITVLALCVLAWAAVARGSPRPRGILYTLLRDNVAGAPVVHQKQDWSFDPDAGLGEDGRQEERRQQQAYRDSFPVPTEQDWHP